MVPHVVYHLPLEGCTCHNLYIWNTNVSQKGESTLLVKGDISVAVGTIRGAKTTGEYGKETFATWVDGIRGRGEPNEGLEQGTCGSSLAWFFFQEFISDKGRIKWLSWLDSVCMWLRTVFYNKFDSL